MAINKRNLIFTTACIARPGIEAKNMIYLLRKSCDALDIPLVPYGTSPDAVFRGWVDIKIDKFCEAARQWLADGFTHVFYTDGRDSVMLSGVDEIVEKYNMLGAPRYLISCEDQCYPFSDRASEFPDPGHEWRYIGAGQFMGEIAYMLGMWGALRCCYSGLVDENHDQGWLELGYVDWVLNRKDFVLDTGCVIFQCVREGVGKPLSNSRLEARGPRVYNTVTYSYPCALHFPGGYSDPVTGKEEIILPVLKELGWET